MPRSIDNRVEDIFVTWVICTCIIRSMCLGWNNSAILKLKVCVQINKRLSNLRPGIK